MAIEELIGKKILGIEIKDDKTEILFKTDDGEYKMHHHRDCCEDVHVEDCGEISDIIGKIVTNAEKVSCCMKDTASYCREFEWTFYRIGTEYDFVIIRWVGKDDGYYSKEVDFCKVNTENKCPDEW